MAELYLVKNDILTDPDPTLIERAKSSEFSVIQEWLDKELGSRAVAIWCSEIIGIDESNSETGQVLEPMEGSVAGVLMGMRRVIVRRPKASDRSFLGSAEVVDVAVFSTSYGPADISDLDYEQMQNNDTTAASLFKEVGVPLSAEVDFGPLRDNSSTEEDELAASSPKLYVVR